MLCYDPYSVAQANYERRYPTTWIFDKSNVDKAYRLYLVGLMEELGIYQMLLRTYGYRERRAENFLKEIRFWDEKTKRWIANNILVKVYSSYRSSRESIEVEGEIVLSVPIGEFYINEDYFVDLFYSFVERSIPIYLASGVDVGVQCLELTYVDPRRLVGEITLLYTIERHYIRVYTYRYTFSYKMRDVVIA